ncbi:MAG: allantoicase, partial [Acidobacteria bacterium]
RRGPGHDWCVVRLGAAGRVVRVEVDTSHFKGNYPESCSLEAACAPEGTGDMGESVNDIAALDSLSWRELLPRTRLQAHTRHFFEEELQDAGTATHARFQIFPDGGVSRLRLYGTILD